MLYNEMDMDGCFDSSLHIEEGISSGSSGEEQSKATGVPECKREPKKVRRCYFCSLFQKQRTDAITLFILQITFSTRRRCVSTDSTRLHWLLKKTLHFLLQILDRSVRTSEIVHLRIILHPLP